MFVDDKYNRGGLQSPRDGFQNGLKAEAKGDYTTWFLVEQSADTVLRQWTLFAAVLFAVFQVMLACLSSSSSDPLQVFTSLPTFLLPFGFYSRACLVVSDVGFSKVWPLKFHLRLAISAGIRSCPALAQSPLLLIFSGQYIFRVFLGHSVD